MPASCAVNQTTRRLSVTPPAIRDVCLEMLEHICSSWNKVRCIFPGSCRFKHICVTGDVKYIVLTSATTNWPTLLTKPNSRAPRTVSLARIWLCYCTLRPRPCSLGLLNPSYCHCVAIKLPVLGSLLHQLRQGPPISQHMHCVDTPSIWTQGPIHAPQMGRRGDCSSAYTCFSIYQPTLSLPFWRSSIISRQ